MGLCLLGIQGVTIALESIQDPTQTFSSPVALVWTPKELYFIDHDQMRVLAVDPTGQLRTVAGSGSLTASGDGGLATQAGMYAIGLGQDNQGNLLIADHGNHRIRQVNPQGQITTIVGTGVSGSGGDGDRATQAQLQEPVGVAVDKIGNSYIADYSAHRIRKVDSQGQITTLIGTGQAGFSPDGTLAQAAQINSPWAIALDCQDQLVFSDLGSGSVKRLVNGKLQTLMQDLERPTGLAFDCRNGETLYISDVNRSQVYSLTDGIKRIVVGADPRSLGDGGPGIMARLSAPYALALDDRGQLLIADTSHNRIRIVDSQGFITTLLAPQGR